MPAASAAKGIKYDWDAAWHLFLAGATHEELSTMLDIPMVNIVKYSSAHMWANRRAKGRENAHKAISQDLTRRMEAHRIKHQNFMMDQLEVTSRHVEEMEIGRDKEAGQVHVMEKLNVMDKQDQIARRVLKLDQEQNSDPVAAGFALIVGAQQLRLRESLVNESPTIDVEMTPSAISPLLEDSEAFTGILSPLNGHSNGTSEPVNGEILPIQPISSDPGHQKEPKALPVTIKFNPPKPLVNENEDE